MSKYTLPLDVKKVLFEARQRGQVIVLATGVFDVLHREHIAFLRKAKQTGDLLLVGVETDERVRVLKGPDRPVNQERVRAANLMQTGIPDEVFLLPQDFDDPREHRAFIRQVNPDILAASSHTPYLEEKRAIMNSAGGELRVVHKHNSEVSTTKLLERDKSQPNRE